jgi:hypothetical protein
MRGNWRPFQLALLLLSLATLNSCTSMGHCDESKHEPSLDNLPIYSGATSISDNRIPSGNRLETRLRVGTSREAVLAFYEDAFVKDGWEFLQHSSSSADLSFSYANCCHYARLWITIESSSSTETIVRVDRNARFDLCM